MQWTKYSERNQRIKELLASGESISHIAKLLGLSKSVVSYYKPNNHCHSDTVTDRVKAVRLRGTPTNKVNWAKKRKEIIDIAVSQWDVVKQNPDIMLLLGLYWGEGTRRTAAVGIVNNDSGIIKIFINWLQTQTQAPIRITIRYYPEQNEQQCREYWMNMLGLSVIVKPKKWLGKKRKQYSEHGICSVQCSDWKLKLTILTWLNCLRKSAIGEESRMNHTKPVGCQW